MSSRRRASSPRLAADHVPLAQLGARRDPQILGGTNTKLVLRLAPGARGRWALSAIPTCVWWPQACTGGRISIGWARSPTAPRPRRCGGAGPRAEGGVTFHGGRALMRRPVPLGCSTDGGACVPETGCSQSSGQVRPGEEAFSGGETRMSRPRAGIRAAGSAGRGILRPHCRPAAGPAAADPAPVSRTRHSSSGSSAFQYGHLTTPGSSTIAGTDRDGKRPERMSITTSFWSSSSQRWLLGELVNPRRSRPKDARTPAPSV